MYNPLGSSLIGYYICALFMIVSYLVATTYLPLSAHILISQIIFIDTESNIAFFFLTSLINLILCQLNCINAMKIYQNIPSCTTIHLHQKQKHFKFKTVVF